MARSSTAYAISVGGGVKVVAYLTAWYLVPLFREAEGTWNSQETESTQTRTAVA